MQLFFSTAAGTAEDEYTRNDRCQSDDGSGQKELVGNARDELLLGAGVYREGLSGLAQQRLLRWSLWGHTLGLLNNGSRRLSGLRVEGGRDRSLGRVMNKEINLVTTGAAGKVNSIQQILVGGDRDRVALVIHVAQSITRVAKSTLLDYGLAAHCLKLSAELGSHLGDQVGDARGAQDVHTVNTTTRSLELEGERRVLSMVLVVLRSHFRVLVTPVVRSGLVRQHAVIIL
jgi:hypothetical protein